MIAGGQQPAPLTLEGIYPRDVARRQGRPAVDTDRKITRT
jgi:hypothetical protein